jgi:hypothetical protein
MHKIPSPPQAFFDESGVNADDRVWDYGRACYALALSRGVPADMVLVPREPTPEMQRAYFDSIDKHLDAVAKSPFFGRHDNHRVAYRAMLAAAPAAAGAQGEDAVLFENVRGHVISELNKIARRIANVSPNVSEEVEQLAAMLVVGATEPLTPPAPQPAAADGGVRERAREIAGIITRNVCETDPADPDRPDTVSVRHGDLLLIAETAISAALSSHRQAGDGWLPIESAPKKGRVMLYDADRIPSILIAHWRHGAWWGDMTNSGRSIVWREATHWRPLPAPPAARSGGGG